MVGSAIRRAFCAGTSAVSSEKGAFLHRFAGLASKEDYPDWDESHDDFDTSDSSFPIVSQVQRSKPRVHQGVFGNERNAERSRGVLNHQFRSKRAEEIYKRSHMIFEGPVKVRVMDVDEFRLDELHHYFMFTLVRRFPAERCVKVAIRVALFRDKHSQHSFESMSRDIAKLFGPIHGAELTALFARCYNTIPVAFMLDYTRRFGKFSRRYISMQVDKTMNPRLFDFVRYPGGVRPLPSIVTRPFALRSFAWLLPPCSAKRYLFQHLLAHSGDPKVLERLRLEEGEVLDQLKAISSGKEIDPGADKGAKLSEKVSSAWKRVKRPEELLQVETDVYSKQPACADDIIEALEKTADKYGDYDPLATQKIKVQAFKSPLSDDTDALDTVNTDKRRDLETGWQDFEHPQEAWWKNRRISSRFFRYNKKAYKLHGDEGWKQIPDPRGETPDYMRPKMLRNSKRMISAVYRRKATKKRRDLIMNQIISREASSSP